MSFTQLSGAPLDAADQASLGRFMRGRRRRRRRVKGKLLTKRQRLGVARILNRGIELKFFDTAVSSNIADPTITSPTPAVLSAITQATTASTDNVRVGDRVVFKKFTYRFTLTFADNFNRCRVIFFQWKPSSTPVPSNILLNGVSGAIDMTSQYSHDFRTQYKILSDRMYTLIGNGLAATNPLTPVSAFTVAGSFNKYRKQGQYAASTTTGTNQIYVMAFSDSLAVPHPAFALYARQYFTDA